jgi:hypothetical protein
VPNPLPLQLDLGNRDRIIASQKYYVHAVVTLGTIAEREVDAAGDAVFGKESETNGLGSLGPLVFRTVLQVSDYLQSVTSETRKPEGVRGGPAEVAHLISSRSATNGSDAAGAERHGYQAGDRGNQG